MRYFMKVSAKDFKIGDLFICKKSGYNGIIYNIRDFNMALQFDLTNIKGHKQSYYFYPEQVELEKIECPKQYKEFKDAIYNYNRTEGIRRLSWIGGELGSDPECFVTDKKGTMIPSFEFLKSKEEKDKTIDAKDHLIGNVNRACGNQSIFWDGFQGEFNVYSASCLAWVCDSTYLGLRTLQEKARAYQKGAKVTIKNTFEVDLEMLQELDPKYVAFGCMPSFNIYGHQGLKQNGIDVPFRSAGGHIHFGIKDHFERGNKKILVEAYVKALDAILGVACVSLFANHDDPRRRTMYGLAGEYRLPDHGLEYRTLSNAWLSHPLIMNMVFELARRCVSVGHNDMLKFWNATEEETIHCINNCDVALAREILARNKDMFVNLLRSHCYDDNLAKELYKIYMSGMECIVKDPDDIEGNWGLDKQFNGHCEGKGQNISHIRQIPKYDELINDTSIEIYEQLIKDIQEIEEAPAIPKKKQVG